MPWGVNLKISVPDGTRWVVVEYECGERMIMPAQDYLMTGYGPPISALPFLDEGQTPN